VKSIQIKINISIIPPNITVLHFTEGHASKPKHLPIQSFNCSASYCIFRPHILQFLAMCPGIPYCVTQSCLRTALNGQTLEHVNLRKRASSGKLRHVTLVRTDGSKELSVSIIRVTRICELGTTTAVTSNRHML
jgi:hypothetical protein